MSNKEFSQTLLDSARDGNELLVEILLSSGGDPNLCDEKDLRSPLLVIAIMEGHLSIVNKLLAAGADPNIPDSLGRTPLVYAAAQDDKEALSLLLAAKASREKVDLQGFTPRFVALYRGHINIVRELGIDGLTSVS